MQQTEPGNQPTSPAYAMGSLDSDLPSRLIVISFDKAADAEKLYESLKELDEKKLLNLDDAVVVSKGADGDFKVEEKVHKEKRTGMLGGAVLGGLVGFMLGGPVLGLAGGALVGRLVGRRTDLGIDDSTIKSISSELDAGKTALFVAGSSHQTTMVLDAFKGLEGRIIETTVDADVKKRLQQALDEESST